MAKRKATPTKRKATPRKKRVNVKNLAVEGDTVSPETIPLPRETEYVITLTLRVVERDAVGYQSYQAEHGANVQAHVNGRQYSALAAVFAGLGLPRVIAGREVGSKADAVRAIFDAIADQIDAAKAAGNG